MARGISTVDRSSRNPACLRNNHVEFVIRYYSETTQIPTKVITRGEAEALSLQGIRIGAVYQDRQNQAGDFSNVAGARDGNYAFAYARSIGQPANTGIFFAVDYDASNADISGPITRYFHAVAQAFSDSSGGGASFRIGVYGSGLTCRRLKEAGLVDLTWLAQATGWRESSQFTGWDCKQGFGNTALCNLTSWEPCETSGSTNWLFTLGPAVQPSAPPVNSLPVLRFGDEGAEVRRLQEHLNIWLRTEGATLLIVDGDFRGRTERAVKAFQSKNVDNFGAPLAMDGVVGGLTWGALVRFGGGVNPPRVTPATLDASGNTDPAWSKSMPAAGFGGTRRGRQALEVAVAELNANAREIGGNNRGTFVRKYLNGLVEEGNPWCAGFVSWCFSQSGSMPFNYSVGARNIRSQLATKNMTYDDAVQTPPEPGDLVIWWRGSPSGWQGHIGFVHHLTQGRLYTIEGNRTSHVQGFSYPVTSLAQLLGFARIG